ncbi:MAG: ChaN family lipoprotein [Elusimicrobiota bacterium]
MNKTKMTMVFSFLISVSAVCSSQEQSPFYSVKEKKFLSFEEVSASISAADAVYVGETHDKESCHKAQLEALKVLDKAKNEKVAVGFEMLNSSLQPILDEFASGAIDEAAFLEKVNWKKEWGFDYNLYKPIFDYIRLKKLKALALNIPRKIVSKTARGGLKVLDEEDKKFLPEKIKVNKDKKYTKYLKETFGGHGDNPMNKIMTFDNYRLSMAVWNESMADKAASFLKENKDWSVLIVAGNGHVMYNAAIPWSMKKRIKKIKNLSFYTEDLSKKEDFIRNPQPLADIIWFVDFGSK